MAEHTITLRVRYQETDGQGRVHHANYLTYFEQGRVELMRSLGGDYRAFESEGLMLVIAEINVRYLGAALFDDILEITTRETKIRGVRIHHAYEVRRDGDLICSATSTVACIDATGKVRPLPESIRTLSNGV